jgi:hypothetical protein
MIAAALVAGVLAAVPASGPNTAGARRIAENS